MPLPVVRAGGGVGSRVKKMKGLSSCGALSKGEQPIEPRVSDHSDPNARQGCCPVDQIVCGGKCCSMPAGLVDEKDSVGGGFNGCGDLREVQVHRFGIAGIVRRRPLMCSNPSRRRKASTQGDWEARHRCGNCADRIDMDPDGMADGLATHASAEQTSPASTRSRTRPLPLTEARNRTGGPRVHYQTERWSPTPGSPSQSRQGDWEARHRRGNCADRIDMDPTGMADGLATHASAEQTSPASMRSRTRPLPLTEARNRTGGPRVHYQTERWSPTPGSPSQSSSWPSVQDSKISRPGSPLRF
jgi:hypothetical protein